MLALNDIETTDARADMHADARSIFWCDFEAAHLHGLIGCSDGQVDKAGHLLQLFFLDEVKRIKVPDFGGNLTGEVGSIELRNAPHTALAGMEVLPYLLRGITHRADQP